MAPQPLQALGAATLAIIAALCLTWTAATAQEPTAAVTGTTLHPGANLVGWVGETAPVSQLFRDIPQLETVWAWDAELDDWIVAGRNVPEGLDWLWQVSPGMGLHMILNGDQPFLWQRSTEPTRGLVELRTGWNLVAWSGANETPIDDATKGIGWSLREVRRHNAETQQWTAWTSPERTAQLIATAATDQSEETPTIQRGEALWINVARAIRWLQPTDILPRLVFPGGASDELQTRVREDLESVLAFYRTQYGIQADPGFTISVAKDVDALIQAERDDGEEIDDAREARLHALWDRSAGFASWRRILVKQSSWPDDLSTGEIARGRYHLTHEYFHVIQVQLDEDSASQWLVEGTADWAEGEHQVMDGERTLQDLREQEQSELSSHTPTLRSTEEENDVWEYTLGWLATDQLTAVTGSDSWLEFWRRLTPTEIGPHQRWNSTPDWQTAFNETFDLPVSDFYAKFDEQQREQAAENGASATSYDNDVHWIRGRVTDESDAPVVDAFVNAIRIEDGTGVGWNQRAETDDDGAFAVRAPEDGDYRLSVSVFDGCTHYYVSGMAATESDDAQLIRIPWADDTTGIVVRLSQDACGKQISGRVIGPEGEPLAGIFVNACLTADGTCAQGDRTTFDGSFSVLVPVVGDYRLSVIVADYYPGVNFIPTDIVFLGQCIVHYRSYSAPTTDWREATPIPIANTGVTGLRVSISPDLCHQQVIGSVGGIQRLRANNFHVSVDLCQVVDTECKTTTRHFPDRDGPFAVIVPTAGTYRISYHFDANYNPYGCELCYNEDGLTSNVAEAMRFNVNDSDVRIDHRQLQMPLCRQQITGRLVDANGAPLTRVSISICQLAGDECAARLWGNTDADGLFAVTVPVAGAYRLSAILNGCSVYHSVGGPVTRQAEASPINVAEADSPEIQLRIPEGMCAYQIRGSVTKADGQPLTDAIWACREVDALCVEWTAGNTDVEGSFAITVPVDGRYHVWFDLDGCTIYFRAGGFTTTFSERGIASVAGGDERLNPRQIPAEMCAHRISGRFVDANGAPLASKWMNVCGTSDCSGVWTDVDGHFTIRVPGDDSYTFDVSLIDSSLADACGHRLADQALGSPDNPVRVTGANVTGITLRLPGTIEELCN